MTVSRVINRDQNVQPANRERVAAAIKTLNYSPNAAARTLAGAVQTRLALVYGNPSAAYLSEILLGTLEEASQTDVQIVLERSDEKAGAAIARRLIKQRLDGVILPPPFCDSSPLLSALHAARIPTAVIASASPAKGAFSVAINDALAAQDMTQHLVKLGHRRIGFIIGNRDQTASLKRLEGYQAALKQANIAYNSKLVAQGDFTYRSGLHAANRLLGASPAPTAIFASNDDMAAAVVAAAHMHHMEVPKDLSVCGFDDTALATTISPELTTIRQPVAAMARAAVAKLAAAHQKRRRGVGSHAQQTIFSHEFIGRNSDAAPRR